MNKVVRNLLSQRSRILHIIDSELANICMIDVALVSHGYDVSNLPVVGYLDPSIAPAVKGHAAPESI